tara:strand:+ start:1442 stop:2338 length:897 start_codon:yes stop_codon:yes gene_type:complete
MLGFVSLSETPISQVTTALIANAFVPSAQAQFNAGTLDYDAKAFQTIPSVSATGSVDIEFDAKGFTFISDVASTTGVNSISSFGKASNIPTAVSASFSVNVFADIDAKANILIPATTITSNSGTLGFDAQASNVLSGVVLALNNYNFTDEDAQASTTLPSVTASFNVNSFSDVDAKATTLFGNMSAIITSEALGFSAKAKTNPITGVSLTLNNFDFTDEDAQATLTLSSLSALLSANLADPAAVIFPYQDYASQYNKNRTLFINRQDTKNTVYVTKQDTNNTVYISRQDTNNTVYITA